jgi:hypothetical protein
MKRLVKGVEEYGVGAWKKVKKHYLLERKRENGREPAHRLKVYI